MTLNLEVGHFYVGRDGVVIAIGSKDCDPLYPFNAAAANHCYTPQGGYDRAFPDHPRNLLFECDADGWVKWEGGECPIPWAKAGEFEVRVRSGRGYNYVDPLCLYWDGGGVAAFRLIPKEEKASSTLGELLRDATGEHRRDTFTISGPALRELIGAAKDAQVLLERSGDESANRCVRALDEAINQVRSES